MKNRVISVKGTEVAIASRHEQDYISLSDMVRSFEGGGAVIEQWLRNKDTVLFLGVWEQLNNPAFNTLEFDGIRNEAGRNSFFLSTKKWVEATGAIKERLIPPLLSSAQTGIIYASEADLLNVALFGITTAQWRHANADQSGNMRDVATLEQLVVLSNLESINAVLIHQGVPAPERLAQLNAIAIMQMRSLVGIGEIAQLSAPATAKRGTDACAPSSHERNDPGARVMRRTQSARRTRAIAMGIGFGVGALVGPLAAQADTLYLCKAYSGGTFWTNGQCSKQQALIERIVTVPDGMQFDQSANVADFSRFRAMQTTTDSVVENGAL